MEEKNENEVPTLNENELIPSMSQKYFYHFDFQNLTESGYVEIFQDKIILLFPDKHNLSENTKDSYIYNKNVNVFINKHIKFSYQWLPIYTFLDFQKIKDMLSKVYYEFLRLVQWLDYENYGYEFSRYYSELVTVSKAESYTLNCFEDIYNISIDLELKERSNIIPIKTPFDLQIYIGSNLIFCIKRDLKLLDFYDLCYVLSFILQKIK